MSIAALIRKPRSGEIATATVATDATQPLFVAPLRVIQPANVATVASVAVANAQDAEAAKTDGVIGKLAAIPTTVASVATVAVATLPDAETATHHTWLVTLPTGERFSAMYAPPKTAAEIQARYPNALVEREPEQLRGLYVDVVKMGIADWPDDQATEPDTDTDTGIKAKAICSRCTHWTPDPINPSGGLGRCTIAAPASRHPGSLWPWPDAEIHCTRFQEITPC